MDAQSNVKFNAVLKDTQRSSFAKYRDLVYGQESLGAILWAEAVMLLSNNVPGALGLWLRSKLYRSLFASVGRGVVFGRNLTIRHPHKIRIGHHAMIDDHCVIDAKGGTNAGITLGNNVYVGRNTILYCKNGDIVIEDGVNISSNCQMFSTRRLVIGEGTMIAAYSYFLSGGEYDFASNVKFSDQPGQPARGDLEIGPNCWIGARVTVLDAASVGPHCVIGAGAVVTKPIPADSLAVGVPARVVRSIRNP